MMPDSVAAISESRIATPSRQAAVEARSLDRRGEHRRRVYKGATIMFNGGYCAMQCIVMDLSPSGARLSFGDTVGVPSAFEIRIAGERRWRRAQVRWRRADGIGVALLPAA